MIEGRGETGGRETMRRQRKESRGTAVGRAASARVSSTAGFRRLISFYL